MAPAMKVKNGQVSMRPITTQTIRRNTVQDNLFDIDIRWRGVSARQRIKQFPAFGYVQICQTQLIPDLTKRLTG